MARLAAKNAAELELERQKSAVRVNEENTRATIRENSDRKRLLDDYQPAKRPRQEDNSPDESLRIFHVRFLFA